MSEIVVKEIDRFKIVICSSNVSTGDDKWYEYHDKVDEHVTQRDAYNRGMRGQLDGDKAQAANF